MEDLKFGVFDHLDRGGRALTDLYEQRLKIVEHYDRAGSYAYHLAEHHPTPLGMARLELPGRTTCFRRHVPGGEYDID